LDTSHSLEYPKRMQAPDCPEDQKVPGLQAITCLRFETPFQNKEGLDKRQAILEGWGVKVTTDFKEAIKGADAYMLEINDGSYHLEYFKKVAKLGKPVFLDKPLACSLADGRAILRLAAKHKTRVWSGSALPFCEDLIQAKVQFSEIRAATIYGALGDAPAGDSLIWYGVHTCEMLQSLMGRGPLSVQAVENKTGIVSVFDYGNDRQGVVLAIRDCWNYGGHLLGKKQGQVASVPFECNTGNTSRNILREIKKFFEGGPAPVELDVTFEGLAMMLAARKAITRRKAVEIPKL
jgi:hypothetical protein